MTPKKYAFAAAYLIESNGKCAAIAAGYTERSAKTMASRLLTDPEVAAVLDRLRGNGAVVAGGLPAGEPVDGPTLTPLAYMLGVVNDPDADESRRDRMASASACYVHAKIGEGGKKDEKVRAANKAGKGKFASAAAPRLVVNNR